MSDVPVNQREPRPGKLRLMQRALTALEPVYRPTRTVTIPIYCAFVIVLLAGPWLTWHVLFEMEWVRQVVLGTTGLISATLIANAFTAASMGVLLFAWARLRPRDLGLVRSKLAMGLMVTVACWAFLNTVMFAGTLATISPIEWHPLWSDRGASAIVGALIAQLLGNALVEEAGDRGFLLPQLFGFLEARSRMSPRAALALAIIVSQTLFALAHLPRQIELGMSATLLLENQLWLVVHGICFALLYMRTGNLFIVVGIHALGNTPTALVESPVHGRPLVTVFALLLWVCWPWLSRKAAAEDG